jgi:hypothetical protein
MILDQLLEEKDKAIICIVLIPDKRKYLKSIKRPNEKGARNRPLT